MTDLTTPRALPVADPERTTSVPGPREPLPAQPPDPLLGAVALTRLLSLSRPTAAQALELGAGLLEAVTDRAGGSSGAVHPVVTADGAIALAPVAEGSIGRPVARVLADLAAAARHPGAPGSGEPLGELDRAATDLGSEAVPGVARRLSEAAAGIDRPRVRGELAALARAVGGLPGGASGVVGARPRPAGVPVRPVPRPTRRPRSTGRRVGAWLLSVVVLGAVVTAEVVLLGDDITTDIDLLLDAGRSGEEPSDEPEPDGLPVAAPAPPSAGPVLVVDLRPLGPCAPGAPCTVRLLVRLVPSPEPRVVAWSYRVVDRCTGAESSLPGGTVTVPPQADRTAVVGEVPLPPLAGAALFAVTDLPAVAASGAVSVGSCLPAGPGA